MKQKYEENTYIILYKKLKSSPPAAMLKKKEIVLKSMHIENTELHLTAKLELKSCIGHDLTVCSHDTNV